MREELENELVLLILEIEGKGFESEKEEALIFMPVRRNLLCFLVCSLAKWIERSHSLHSIDLSSWQNKYARFSCKKKKIIIQSFIKQIQIRGVYLE